MTSSHQKTLILLLAVFAIFWTAWQKLEWVEEQKWVAAKSEVNNRPMMAAGLFLQSIGYSVSRVIDQKRLDAIPAGVSTLFLCEGKMNLSRAHYDELERWLQAGGHLIINSSGGGRLHSDDDELEQQPAYGVRSQGLSNIYGQYGVNRGNTASNQDCWRQRIDFEPDRNDEIDLSDVVEAMTSGLALPAKNTLETVSYLGELPGKLDDKDTRVVFEAANWLEIDSDSGADWQWNSARGVQLASLLVGNGRLTVMSDFSPFFNQGIGLFDNAFALQSIVQSGERIRGQIWFHERELAFPNIFSVIWSRTPQILFMGGVLTLLVVWSLFARRLEPSSTKLQKTSQLRQQLYAIAFYRWRVGDMSSFSQLLRPDTTEKNFTAASDETSEQAGDIPQSKGLLIDRARAHWSVSNNLRGERKHG